MLPKVTRLLQQSASQPMTKRAFQPRVTGLLVQEFKHSTHATANTVRNRQVKMYVVYVVNLFVQKHQLHKNRK